jgi:hypothetical protein
MRLYNHSGKIHDVRSDFEAAAAKMATIDTDALAKFVLAELDLLAKHGVEFAGVHVVRRAHKPGALELSVSISALPCDPTIELDVGPDSLLEQIGGKGADPGAKKQ